MHRKNEAIQRFQKSDSLLFHGKNILIGITGGIAAYKTCEIVRELKKLGAEIRVVMTKAAQHFVTPLTFETLSEHPVLCELFPEKPIEAAPIHIKLARWPHAILVCPATANSIGKVANGIADDLLSTLIMAATVPIIFCPAMNQDMYQNPVVQENIRKLQALNYVFVEPEQGSLACGEQGWGRLAEKQTIIDTLKKVLLTTSELSGKRVLVTAGRTEELIDPVRMITNFSSGKMGFALAEAAALRGAEVTLVSGPTELKPYCWVNYRKVRTASEMAQVVREEFGATDILIMAAAVADFRPKMIAPEKIKKDQARLVLELEKTDDILHEAGQNKGHRILVGFALETEPGLENARAKLQQKNLDLIVWNNPLEQGAGFGWDTNKVTLIDRWGTSEDLPLMSKRQVAERILDKICVFLAESELQH
ncbi:MAG: bifunctional phosphopantothenoylcysteine decarboxylase/phosphopantothenate--cysteine ligase CoaBC [candidate division KSB1 bacterium]|nr:bifunctional phosphopantothenoylcysteine decarboxylase/phosphopantothenate--cysteine ligase CoaBC [candidate division KSB1 bacterium]